MSALGVQLDQRSFEDFLRACEEAPFGTKREIRRTLGAAGELVRVGATARMLPKHRRTAKGYQVRLVRDRSVRVEQSIPKTTGFHAKWGGWQMRHALLPSIAANRAAIEADLDEAVGRICNRFERG